MPHITQIAAPVMKTDARLSCFVSPKVPISVNAEQVTGISWDGEHMQCTENQWKLYQYQKHFYSNFMIFFF